jgi:hypothetical protein
MKKLNNTVTSTGDKFRMHYNPDLSGDVIVDVNADRMSFSFPGELIEQIIEKHFLPDGLGVGAHDVVMRRLERIESMLRKQWPSE